MPDTPTFLIIDKNIPVSLWDDFIQQNHIIIDDILKHTLRCADHTALALPPECELSLLFTDNDSISGLNLQYRGKKGPTNVLSFPLVVDKQERQHSSDPLCLGDIVVAYEVIESQANEQSKSFRDHTLHLLVHGFLHILGYDHESEEAATKMEALEIKILEKFSVAAPYHD